MMTEPTVTPNRSAAAWAEAYLPSRFAFPVFKLWAYFRARRVAREAPMDWARHVELNDQGRMPNGELPYRINWIARTPGTEGVGGPRPIEGIASSIVMPLVFVLWMIAWTLSAFSGVNGWAIVAAILVGLFSLTVLIQLLIIGSMYASHILRRLGLARNLRSDRYNWRIMVAWFTLASLMIFLFVPWKVAGPNTFLYAGTLIWVTAWAVNLLALLPLFILRKDIARLEAQFPVP